MCVILTNNPLEESKFISTLTTKLKDSIGLSDREIIELSDYFKVQNGQIAYAQFCSVIHDNGIYILSILMVCSLLHL